MIIDKSWRTMSFIRIGSSVFAHVNYEDPDNGRYWYAHDNSYGIRCIVEHGKIVEFKDSSDQDQYYTDVI